MSTITKEDQRNPSLPGSLMLQLSTTVLYTFIPGSQIVHFPGRRRWQLVTLHAEHFHRQATVHPLKLVFQHRRLERYAHRIQVLQVIFCRSITSRLLFNHRQCLGRLDSRGEVEFTKKNTRVYLKNPNFLKYNIT